MPFKNTTGKRLYLNVDRTKVVEEGDAAAAFLLVGPEGELPDEDAEKYGLTKQPEGRRAEAEPAAEPESKAVEPAEDKASTPPRVPRRAT